MRDRSMTAAPTSVELSAWLLDVGGELPPPGSPVDGFLVGWVVQESKGTGWHGDGGEAQVHALAAALVRSDW